jgi:hypothetical protein
MAKRVDRLKNLLAVQEQLKALHEIRHAGHVAAASAARAEADELSARIEAPDSLSGLFPEIYHRRIGAAVDRETEARALAKNEADRVTAATLTTNVVERAWKVEARKEERVAGDRERLDLIGQTLATRPAK